MPKRGRLTGGSGLHGDARSKQHADDKAHNQKRRRRRVEYRAHDVADERDYEPFVSDVSAIGVGRNWLRDPGAIWREVNSQEWATGIAAIEVENSWYHCRQVRQGKVGYYERKVKDRVKLGATDKTGRAFTDVMRETIDLRPDHSRAIQYLLQQGKRREVEDLLTQIRAEKIRHFERLYHRKVIALGEHPDSGQFHNDLWHGGIEITKVTDNQAREVVRADGSVKVIGGHEREIRSREPFRLFGVGVGVCSWDRHRRALLDAGEKPDSLMGETLNVLKRNKKSARHQNGESPRDLALLEALDTFVNHCLHKIDHDLSRKALEEYSDWIKTGYSQGKLGVKEEPAQITRLKDEVKELHKDREALEKEVAGLRKDVENHAEIRNWIGYCFAQLLAIPKVIDLIRPLSKVWPILEDLAEATGVDLKKPLAPQIDKFKSGLATGKERIGGPGNLG